MPEAPAQSIGHKHAGPVFLLATLREANAAEGAFRAALERGGHIVGFDMEWKPDRCPQHNHKVALVQLAVADTVWLVRTSCMQRQLPAFLRSILVDPSVIKVTVDFDGCDRNKLGHSFGIQGIPEDAEQCGILDLSRIAKACGFPEIGLKRLGAHVGYRIEKNRKMSVSDWEVAKLSEAQLRYARDDAYFSLLTAAPLLREAANSHALTPLQTRALAGWTAEVERAALAALEEEDMSAQDALQEEMVAELRGLLLNMSSANGALGPLLVEAQRLGPMVQLQKAGISTGKKFFTEHRDDFSVTCRQDNHYVRARTDWERGPVPAGALALPWADDERAALAGWAELERARDPANVPLSGVDAAALCYRLTKVACALEDRQEGPAAAAVRKLSCNRAHCASTIRELEMERAGVVPQPAEPGPKQQQQQQQQQTNRPQPRQPAERLVFLKLPGRRAIEPETLRSELEAELGQDVFEDIVITRPKAPWVFVALHSAAAVAELLERTGTTDEISGSLRLASGDAVVCRYKGRL